MTFVNKFEGIILARAEEDKDRHGDDCDDDGRNCQFQTMRVIGHCKQLGMFRSETLLCTQPYVRMYTNLKRVETRVDSAAEAEAEGQLGKAVDSQNKNFKSGGS